MGINMILTILNLTIIGAYILSFPFVMLKARRCRLVSSIVLFFWSTTHAVLEGLPLESTTSWSNVSTWTDTYVMGLVFNAVLFLGSVAGSTNHIRWLAHSIYIVWGILWVLCTLENIEDANVQRQVWYPAGMLLAAGLVLDDCAPKSDRDPMCEYQASLLGVAKAYDTVEDGG